MFDQMTDIHIISERTMTTCTNHTESEMLQNVLRFTDFLIRASLTQINSNDCGLLTIQFISEQILSGCLICSHYYSRRSIKKRGTAQKLLANSHCGVIYRGFQNKCSVMYKKLQHTTINNFCRNPFSQHHCSNSFIYSKIQCENIHTNIPLQSQCGFMFLNL